MVFSLRSKSRRQRFSRVTSPCHQTSREIPLYSTRRAGLPLLRAIRLVATRFAAIQPHAAPTRFRRRYARRADALPRALGTPDNPSAVREWHRRRERWTDQLRRTAF